MFLYTFSYNKHWQKKKKKKKQKEKREYRLQRAVLSSSVTIYTSMYFLTCFPFKRFLKRTGVRKHRWGRAGNVVALRRRHRTMLGIFRSLGRPQDAERFFGLGFFFPLSSLYSRNVLLTSSRCSISLSLASPAAIWNTECLGLRDWVPMAAPGLTPSTCWCFPSCGETGQAGEAIHHPAAAEA